MHGNAVDAVADLGGRVGNVFGPQAPVDGPPSPAAVVGPERSRRRNRDEDPPRFGGIQEYRVQAHPACAGLPAGPGAVAAQARELPPIAAAVGRVEQGGVLDPGVDTLRIGE